MVRVRDEASQSGMPMSQGQISRMVLGEKKWYIRGFGIGPKLSTYTSDAEAQACKEELHRLRSEVQLLCEEQQKEREEERAHREAQQRQIDRLQSILTLLLQPN